MSTPPTAVANSWPERVVEAVSRRLDRGGLSRRSFLMRAAVVGSVLTVAPVRWVMRPTTAYASICGDGASCNQGWTAFCCTINNGANTCPPGSYVAGWWKIDASPFCRGEPRYIIDCNRSPGASCRCRCATGSCDQRRVCCNNFRYGQCNTQIPGVTEVVCRVVICTVPWRWDPACGTTLRTDNRTRSHNAPCLPGRGATRIDLHYQDLGLTGSPLGRPLAAEQAAPRGGAWRRFERGVITWHASTGARTLLDPIATTYRELGGPGGGLGYPVGERTAIPDADGHQVRFERGRILHRGAVAAGLFGPSLSRYDQLGGPTGPLGFPRTSTRPVGDGRGSITTFDGGTIYARSGVAIELSRTLAERYAQLGGPVDSGLGYPTAAAAGGVARFANGALVQSGDTWYAVRGAIARRYLELGGPDGPWGRPAADQQATSGGWVARFGNREVYAVDRAGSRAFILDGPILTRYREEGGPQGPLGWPTSDRIRTRFGRDRASFEGGAIELVGGRTRVLTRTASRRASELP